MKKNEMKDQEQKRTPGRLTLRRETILFLNDPALLELARGADEPNTSCSTSSSLVTISGAC